MTQTATTIHDGYYTVSLGYEHRTFRVHTQPQDATFAPGKQIISYDAARFLVESQSCQETAGKYYAQCSSNCYICNRLLTTPESIVACAGRADANRL